MSILGILEGGKGDIGVEGLVLPPDTRLSLWLVPMGDLTLEPAESRLAFDREGWTAGLMSPLCDFFLLKRPMFGRVSISVCVVLNSETSWLTRRSALANDEPWRNCRV